ncbi:MAG TPA: FtsQ-type POTRA domain-containing protein [Sphingomonadales bacterium]|nr:FtsQ-type POTRA domain-containing protein [Sphingomonadales bacterium]
MWPLKKKAPAKRGAKQAQSLKRRRRLSLFIRGASLAVMGFGLITTLYLWKSGLAAQWMTETRDTVDREIAGAGFAVGEVRITGQKYTSLKQIRAALALYDGQSIVSLDLAEMLNRVEALPWVKAATITRVMPDVLTVAITEHEAAALWQDGGQFFLVDSRGQVITDQGLETFDKLPQVVGAGANEHLDSLLAMKAAFPDLFARVQSAIWVGNRRWDFSLDNGIRIKLPEKGPELAWQRLNAYDKDQKILTRKILAIDLRQHGKTIVRLTPQEAERRRMLTRTGKKEESI